jgi:hypothetical protein
VRQSRGWTNGSPRERDWQSKVLNPCRDVVVINNRSGDPGLVVNTGHLAKLNASLQYEHSSRLEVKLQFETK